MQKTVDPLDQLINALTNDDTYALSRSSQEIAALPASQALLEQGRQLLAAEQSQPQHLQAHRHQL